MIKIRIIVKGRNDNVEPRNMKSILLFHVKIFVKWNFTLEMSVCRHDIQVNTFSYRFVTDTFRIFSIDLISWHLFIRTVQRKSPYLMVENLTKHK